MGRRPSPRAVARERFGFDELRPGQEHAIRSVLAGRDTLVVMPTGAGKSAVYQIAGVLLGGPTVVVSPLVALQRDQVEGLEELGVGGASEVNATLAVRERREAFEDLDEEELELSSWPRSSSGTRRRSSACARQPPPSSSSTRRIA